MDPIKLITIYHNNTLLPTLINYLYHTTRFFRMIQEGMGRMVEGRKVMVVVEERDAPLMLRVLARIVKLGLKYKC